MRKNSYAERQFRQFILGLCLLLPVILVGVATWFQSYRFERDCGGWLKMAADASTVPVALERLDRALHYLEAHDITHGTTAVLLPSPTKEIEPWYTNLKQAQQNLRDFPLKASETDTATTLQKLREVILDHGSSGDSLTYPDWVYLYPNNNAWFIVGVLTVISALVGAFLVVVSDLK